MSIRAILENRIARIKAIDFSGRAPASLERVLDDFLALADTMPLAELQWCIDYAAANAKHLQTGGNGFRPPARALVIIDPEPSKGGGAA